MKAPLIEVFGSIQGEGRHVGRPMVFVRVAVCPIRCLYCDTPHSYQVPGEFTVQRSAGQESHANPIHADAAAALALDLAQAHPWGRATWVSLTGGEPLLYPDFVQGFGSALHAAGRRLMLETAALDDVALRRCAAVVDHLSADYKLPGTLGRGDAEALGIACVACVAVALEAGCSVDVKMVLTASVTEAEFVAALNRLAPLRGRFELVLQPVTPCAEVAAPLPVAALAHFASLAAAFEPTVLPQVHKQLGID